MQKANLEMSTHTYIYTYTHIYYGFLLLLFFFSLHTDFICWRGLLTKLLCTPYENRDDWCIAVCLFKGTYYMCEFETQKKEQEKRTMTDKQNEMCYWGWKFEQYVTAGVYYLSII